MFIGISLQLLRALSISQTAYLSASGFMLNSLYASPPSKKVGHLLKGPMGKTAAFLEPRKMQGGSL